MGKTLNDKKYGKRFAGIIIFYYVLFCILMVIGTFYDLQIDKAVFSYDNLFGIFMEKWGVLVFYIAQLAAFSTIAGAYHPLNEFTDIFVTVAPFMKSLKDKKAGKILFFILHKAVYIGFLYGVFTGANDILKYSFRQVKGHSPMTYYTDLGYNETKVMIIWTVARIILAAISVIVFRFIIKKLNRDTVRAMETVAAVGLLVMLMAAIVDVIKDTFTRVRFREMVAYSHGLIGEDGMTDIQGSMPKEWVKDTDFSAYDYWFRKGDDMGVYDDSLSFPSGHVANIFYFFLIVPFCYKLKKYNKYMLISAVPGIGYIILMALSRLMRGAHYLTDVSAAAIIMITLMLIGYSVITVFENIYDKNKAKEQG